MRKEGNAILLAIVSILLVTLSSCSLGSTVDSKSESRDIPVASTRSMNEADLWTIGRSYERGDVVLFRDSAFVVVQAHTAISTWLPPNVPALFELVRPSDPAYIEWQPGTKYMRGEHVISKDNLYEITQAHQAAIEWQPEATPALYKPLKKTDVDTVTPSATYTFPKTGNIGQLNPPAGFSSAYAKNFYTKFKEKYIRYTYNREWIVMSPQCGGTGYWKVTRSSAYLLYNPVMAYYSENEPNKQHIGLESQKQNSEGHIAVTTSETHGYAMLMAAYMNDKELFDLLVNFYEKFKSKTNGSSELMQWQVWSNQYTYSDRDAQISYRLPIPPDLGMFYTPTDCKTSATDGDMDIAYALLLADKQWSIPEYKTQALKVIKDILQYDIYGQGNSSTRSHIKTGNACKDNDPVTGGGFSWNDGYITRPSDFLLDHLLTFKAVDTTNATKWQNVYDTTKKIILDTLDDHKTAGGVSTGLLPDFMIYKDSLGKYITVEHKVMEKNDMQWYFNAARSMWRISVEAGLSNDTDLYNFLNTFSSWAESSMKTEWAAVKDDDNQKWVTEGGTFYATYNMNGTVLPDEKYWTKYSLSTVMLAASVGTGSSYVRDNIWSKVLKPEGLGSMKIVGHENLGKSGNYYGDTVEMLSLITLSDGWWSPTR